MNNIKTNILFYLLIVVLFLFNGWLWSLSLSEVLAYLNDAYAIPQHKQNVLVQFVNNDSWLKFKIVVLLLSVFVVFLYQYRSIFFKGMYNSFKYCSKLLWEDFRSLTSKEKSFLLAFLLCVAVYLSWLSSEVYFQLDELNSWLYFVERGFLVTISYYPSNNNHIGYNVLCVFCSFFLTPTWAMRITSILASLGVLAVLYLILIRRYNFLLACVGVLLAVSFSSFMWYAIQGRGYMLALLLLVVLFYLISKAKNSSADNVIVVLSAYAIWVVPVTIIPLLVLTLLALYIIRHDTFFVRRVSKVILSIVALSLFLYLPVFVFSDVSTFYENPFVKHVMYIDAPFVLVKEYLPSIITFLIGMDGWYLIVFSLCMLGLLLLMLVRKSYNVLSFVLVTVGLPTLLFLVYPVLLFERTWLWLLIPLLFWITEVFFFLNSKGNIVLMICVIFLILGATISASFSVIKDARINSQKRAYELEELQRCFRKTGASTIHIDSDVLYTYFRYYQKSSMFILKGADDNVQIGDCVLFLNEEDDYSGTEIICKNSTGTLYKLQ